jgi:sulfate adenylyltransferase
MVALNGGPGLTIFFTGLSGAGKTTLAQTMRERLRAIDRRHVRLLDGDVLRRHLSPDLGFSREERDLHVRRVGYLASEITACGAIALCAAIAPYDVTRREVRALVEPVGAFRLVHVATPIEVCERRDVKGLYAKARSGQLARFTGVSDPYEPPGDAEIVVNATEMSVEEACAELEAALRAAGLIEACEAGLRPSSMS